MGGNVSTHEPGPSSVAVLSALKDLVGNPALRLSERNRRFLEFVVRETVDGHADRIKAYTIGVDVFGRDQSFDPAVDPIVRIEANRLRSALANYYDSGGRNDAIRISMSPGTYVPAFIVPGTVAREEQPVKPRTPVPVPTPQESIVVRERSGPVDPETAMRRDLFTNAVMKCLGKAAFKVFWSPPDTDAAAARMLGDRISATLCLDIAVHSFGPKRRYSWRLWNAESGAVLLCDYRDLEARSEPCIRLIDETAGIAACDVARQRSSS
ncbi:hypothetical protein ASE63_23765 [Bosea sp. Root381]|uniref:hypothetical protein n=1 Tax=Bosea sp. Root381 TaxID=1736524 RepID=UPI0007018157|nr:hypothetical protein [Bosea sp. Root381]KRE06727.1 hypothetical protein ASE63_23765 [Bosea sp. Root381]